MTMNIEIIDDINKFKLLRGDWNDLLEKSLSKSIFLTWEWLYYWWIHFKEKKELFIVLIRDKDANQILGIAPFCFKKIRLFNLINITKIKFLGTERVASDFLNFIIYPGLEDKVLTAIYKYLSKISYKWDIVEMGDIDSSLVSVKEIKKSINQSYRVFRQISQICPYINLTESYETMLNSLRPNMRSNIRKRMKNIKSKEKIRLSFAQDRKTLKDNIDNLFMLHDKRFKDRVKTTESNSSFKGKEIKHFHYDIAESFLLKDWLRLYRLDFDDRPIAYLYCFKYKNRMSYYQSGFEPEFRDWGIGNVMLGYCLKDSINNGLEQFHFLRGKEDYKKRWTDKSKKTNNIFICNNNFPGIFFYSYKKIREKIKTVLKG